MYFGSARRIARRTLEEGGFARSIPQEMGHIVLNVTDVEKSTAFYRDVVGFQVTKIRPDRTGAFLTCGVVHHNLALFKAAEGAQPYHMGQVGLRHFAFKVKNYKALQDAYSRLIAAGTKIDHISDHGNTRSVYSLDPDGMLMELFLIRLLTTKMVWRTCDRRLLVQHPWILRGRSRRCWIFPRLARVASSCG